MTRPIYVIGAGGHGKVVLSTLLECGYPVVGIIDDDTSKKGKTLLSIPVVGTLEDLISWDKPVRAVPGIGDNSTRKKLTACLAFVEWISVIHPRAYVHSSARIGQGSVVFAGAVIQPDSRIGAHCIVNTGALIDHDCVLGDFCHAAPGCSIAGGVRIGEGAFLGTGSSIIPGRSVGAWTTAGAGSTIVYDVPASVTVVGTPAMPIKEVKS